MGAIGGLCLPHAAHAQTGLLSHSAANFASHEGNIAYLALGVGLPLLRDRGAGRDHTLRTADSLLTSTLMSEALKAVVRERRPDGTNRTSFPSGHATAAFAVAAIESHYHRREAVFWYAGAFLIADSRVTLRRHYPHDVIVGGILGIATAQLELKSRRGLVLSPLITPDTRGRGVHFQMSSTF